MTIFMRMRLWARHAPPWQVAFTAVMSVLLAAGLVALNAYTLTRFLMPAFAST
jgi:hypothetical protein